MDNLSTNQKLGIGGVIFAVLFLLFLVGRYWDADYLYARSKTESQFGQYSESIKDLRSAIVLTNNEAIYHNEMSRIFSDVIIGFAENNDATTVAKVIPYVINESDTAFRLSPRNMNIRETRISIFTEMALFNPDYFNDAIKLTKETIPLSPTDPKILLALGKIYLRMNDNNDAVNAFKKALVLKLDYQQAISALQDMKTTGHK